MSIRTRPLTLVAWATIGGAAIAFRFWHLADGLVVEDVHFTDMAGLVAQLGGA